MILSDNGLVMYEISSDGSKEVVWYLPEKYIQDDINLNSLLRDEFGYDNDNRISYDISFDPDFIMMIVVDDSHYYILRRANNSFSI